MFEGSCKLIPVKLISKECCKLADEFIPELVDTLASQMNPQIVCSVAGLCNNERIDRLLESVPASKVPSKQFIGPCTDCKTVIGRLRKKLDGMSKSQVLQSFSQVCMKI